MKVPEVGRGELQWKLDWPYEISCYLDLLRTTELLKKRIVWIFIQSLPSYLPLSDLVYSNEDLEY